MIIVVVEEGRRPVVEVVVIEKDEHSATVGQSGESLQAVALTSVDPVEVGLRAVVHTRTDIE
jgi:hypothetical protein